MKSLAVCSHCREHSSASWGFRRKGERAEWVARVPSEGCRRRGKHGCSRETWVWPVVVLETNGTDRSDFVPISKRAKTCRPEYRDTPGRAASHPLSAKSDQTVGMVKRFRGAPSKYKTKGGRSKGGLLVLISTRFAF